ncbi:MAG: hypothetical protein ACOVQ7_19760 [Limnoraphis robusta]|jgi:hypothetical protein
MGQTHRQEYRGYTIMAYQVASEGFARYSFHIMEGDRLCYAAKPEDQQPSCKEPQTLLNNSSTTKLGES